jgi:hypothetical protein
MPITPHSCEIRQKSLKALLCIGRFSPKKRDFLNFVRFWGKQAKNEIDFCIAYF